MSLGPISVEKPLEVRLDPTVSASQEDLRAQQKAGHKLLEMMSVTNDALRILDGLKEQIEGRKATMRKLGRNVKDNTVKTVDAHLDMIRDLEGLLDQSWDGGVPSSPLRLLSKLSMFFNTLDGVNAAPTVSQLAYLYELTVEFKDALAAVNAYLSDRADKLNSALSESRIPGVFVPEPLKLPDLEKL